MMFRILELTDQELTVLRELLFIASKAAPNMQVVEAAVVLDRKLLTAQMKPVAVPKSDAAA